MYFYSSEANIDIVEMGGHRSMGRDAARGMVRIAKCTFIRAKRVSN